VEGRGAQAPDVSKTLGNAQAVGTAQKELGQKRKAAVKDSKSP
jgi:hypothetical protein